MPGANKVGADAVTPSPIQTKVEHLVALLSPLFVALGGFLSSLIAKAVPVNIPASDFTAIFVAGATLAGTTVVTWLLSRTVGHKRVGQVIQEAHQQLDTLVKQALSSQQFGPALSDIEKLLASNRAHIEQAVEDKVRGAVKELGVSPSVEQVAGQVIDNLIKNQVGAEAKTTESASTSATGGVPSQDVPSQLLGGEPSPQA